MVKCYIGTSQCLKNMQSMSTLLIFYNTFVSSSIMTYNAWRHNSKRQFCYSVSPSDSRGIAYLKVTWNDLIVSAQSRLCITSWLKNLFKDKVVTVSRMLTGCLLDVLHRHLLNAEYMHGFYDKGFWKWFYSRVWTITITEVLKLSTEKVLKT